MKKITSLVSAILFLAFALLAQEGSKDTLEHTDSWAAVLQRSKIENKLIFVDCYFTGCHPCAQMDKEVFPNSIVSKEFSENFVGIKIDVFKEKLGDTINMKYNVSGYPTFLVLDANGRLLNMFSGYRDPGMLLLELNKAKQMASRKEWLSGFAANAIDYPEFYKKYFDREDRKNDPEAANAWIKNQKDWKTEAVAMAIFRTGKLNGEIEEYLVNNYTTYKKMYGTDLVLGKTAGILNGQMGRVVNKQKDETAFRQFLKEKSRLFPAEDWKILQHLLGYNYYGSIAKDTLGLLTFMNETPVIYMNYFGALYSNMAARKQLNPANLALLCSWADKTVTGETALDIIRTAAYLHKQNNDMAGFEKYIRLAIAKSKKYNMPADAYEKMLAIK